MTNRLKKVLPQLITEHHSTFTKGYLILDNILIAFETLHSMQKYNSDKDDFIAVKLNMSKLTTGLNRAFLELVMRNMGFIERWINF